MSLPLSLQVVEFRFNLRKHVFLPNSVLTLLRDVRVPTEILLQGSFQFTLQIKIAWDLFSSSDHFLSLPFFLVFLFASFAANKSVDWLLFDFAQEIQDCL